MKEAKRRRAQGRGPQATNPGARGERPTVGADELVDDLLRAAAHANCKGFGDGTRLRLTIESLAQGLGLERGRNRWRPGSAPCCRVAVHRCSTPAGQPMRSSVSSDDGSMQPPRQSSRARLVRSRPVVPGAMAPVRTWASPECAEAGPCALELESRSLTAIAALSVIVHLPGLRDLGDIGPWTRTPLTRRRKIVDPHPGAADQGRIDRLRRGSRCLHGEGTGAHDALLHRSDDARSRRGGSG